MNLSYKLKTIIKIELIRKDGNPRLTINLNEEKYIGGFLDAMHYHYESLKDKLFAVDMQLQNIAWDFDTESVDNDQLDHLKEIPPYPFILEEQKMIEDIFAELSAYHFEDDHLNNKVKIFIDNQLNDEIESI